MRRNPRVVLPEDRQSASLVSELLSNVYSTVVPVGLRTLAGSSELTVEPPRLCEVTSCDVLDNRIAFAYATAGFTVWHVSRPNAKATEIMCETEGSPVHLVRLLPSYVPDPNRANSRKQSGKKEASHNNLGDSSNVIDEDAWGDIAMYGTRPQQVLSAEDLPDLLYVESHARHVIRAVNLQSGKLVDEMVLDSNIVDIRASCRFIGVMLRDHSARIYLRGRTTRLSDAKVINIPHAHPLVLGSRWVAYGTNSGFEAKQNSEAEQFKSYSDQMQSQQQSPSVWQDLTKQFAASAYRLGEVGTKKLAEYLNTGDPKEATDESNQGDNSKPRKGDCACNVIVVKDLLSDRVVCKIASVSSFLHFDESGSLLVSAVKDGQSIHVYSLPRGTLLFKLERGLRPAKIISAAFSPDRRWLAIASNRGTTHIFAVDPSGAQPTLLTHGGENTSSSTSQMQSLGSWLAASSLGSSPGVSTASLLTSPSPKIERKTLIQDNEVRTSASLGKISATHGPLRRVWFPSQNVVRIITGNGVIEDYVLSVTDAGADGGNALTSVDPMPIRALSLERDAEESVLPATPVISGTPKNSSGKDEVLISDILSYDVSVSNFEPQPFLEPPVPVWASPQLVLIQTSNNSKGDAANSLFYQPTGTVLKVRASSPPPGLVDAMRTPAFPSLSDKSSESGQSE